MNGVNTFMMVVTGKQMKEIDRMAIEDYKIPGLKLMETAGTLVYNEIMKSLGEESKWVCVICGSGNNGGDGYVIARKLVNRFIPIKVYSTVSLEKLSGDAGVNYERLLELGVRPIVLDSSNKIESFKNDIKNSEVIVDAILGTGITRNVDDNINNVFDIINESGNKVISVDIPSGIGADDGIVYGAAVKASKTISFQLPKIGSILFPGAEYTGELLIKDIGIPEEAIRNSNSKTYLIDEDMVKKIIKPKKKDSHKGDNGKLLLIAGSKGMAGASVFAGKASLKSGIGLLKMAIPKKINDIVQITVPEAVCLPLGDSATCKLNKRFMGKIMDYAKECTAVAVGPGIGRSQDFSDMIGKMAKELRLPLIIDADAINAIGDRADKFFSESHGDRIITPHPGEMSRLTGVSIRDINCDRVNIAREYSTKWGIIVLLKGARTVVACPEGDVYINVTGNPGMATGGSGDVLTGIASSLVAQNIEAKAAAIASVFIHGKAGDIMSAQTGEHGLTTSDLINGVGITIKSIIGR